MRIFKQGWQVGRWLVVIGWLVAVLGQGWAANTHVGVIPPNETAAWFGDLTRGYVVTACLPGTSGTTTTGAFACTAYTWTSGQGLAYVTQASATVGPLTGGDGVYWIAVHRDQRTTVAGWGRQAGTHYLSFKSAAKPPEPAGGLIVAAVTVASSAVSAVTDVRRSASEALRGMADITEPLYSTAVCDGVTDDTSALTTAIATGRSFDLGSRVCAVSTVLTMNKANVTYRAHSGGGFKFIGANTARMIDVTANRVRFEGVTFDGNGLQPSGFLVYVGPNVDRPQFHSTRFTNMIGVAYGSNALNQMAALGISPYGVTGFEVTQSRFENLTKYNDGTYITPATGLGFVHGILISDLAYDNTDAQPVASYGVIDNVTFYNIQTILDSGLSATDRANFDDGDAIRVLMDPDLVGANAWPTMITNIHCRLVSKRCLKATNVRRVIVENMDVDGAGMTYGMFEIMKIGSSSTVRNVRFRAYDAAAMVTTALQVQGNEGILVDGLDIDFAQTALQILNYRTGVALGNMVFQNIICSACTEYGWLLDQTTIATSTTDMRLLNSRFTITGTSGTCIEGQAATDNTGGVTLQNVECLNGDVKLSGNQNRIDGLVLRITNSSYAGSSTSRTLLEIGASILTGENGITNTLVDASGISTTYVNATRTRLIGLFHNQLYVRGLRLIVPEALSTSFPHLLFGGADMVVEDVVYQGPGRIDLGTTAGGVAVTRGQFRGLTRLGSGATTINMLYADHASNADIVIDNVTDFRPTSGQSVLLNGGTATYVVGRVSTKSSHITPVSTGGLARIDDSGLPIKPLTHALLSALTLNEGVRGTCTDCTVTSGSDNTCAASGTGAFFISLNGVLRCFAAQN